MLASTRLCKSVCGALPRSNSAAVRPGARKSLVSAKPSMFAVSRPRSLHTSAITLKHRGVLEPIKAPEPEILLDGEIVPQSRLNDILAHLGEDDEIPPLQETQMELEPFIVNEVLDVGRHTKILPGTLFIGASIAQRKIGSSLFRFWSAASLLYHGIELLLDSTSRYSSD